MIGFLGESIKNRFPYWSKVRTDPSSYGASLLDVLGSSLEEVRTNAIRAKEQRKAFSEEPIFENSHIQIINLLDDAAFNNAEQLKLANPTISVTGDNISVTRVSSLESLSKSFPTRLELVEEKDFTNSIYEGNGTSDIEEYFGEKGIHIYINIDGEGNFETRDSLAYFDEKYYIVLRGEDIAGNEIEEYIPIKDETVYRSANRFKRLKPIKRNIIHNIRGGDSVEQIGFDSSFKVLKLPFFTSKEEVISMLSMEGDKRSPEDGFIQDNNLFVKLEEENGINYLNYYLVPFSEGKYYRNSNRGSEEHFLINSQVITDTSNENLSTMDFCYDKVRNTLDIIDDKGVIRSFPIGKNAFERTALYKTKRNNLEIEPSDYRPKFGDTIKMYVNNYKESMALNKVVIAREKPEDKSVFNTYEERFANLEFLQADKTWSSNSIYFWENNPVIQESNATNWNVVNFDNEITQKGQWDFYTFEVMGEFEILCNQYNSGVATIEDLNVFLKRDYKKMNNDVLISTTSVICDSNFDISSIDTQLFVTTDTNLRFGIHRDHNDNLIYIYKETDAETKLYKYKELIDVFVYDNANKILGLKEKYTNVSIDYNGLVIEASYD